jgi:sialate O-acetylesterase
MIFGLATGACLTRADVVPASLFCEHAVLQQGVPIPVWGSAAEGEQVTVTLDGRSASTTALEGKWRVELPPLPAGGPHVLTIAGRNRIELTDVLIGEVWVCGGQSNMERQLGPRDGQKPIRNWEAEVAAADFPQIRHFGVAQRLALDPQGRVDGRWLVCSPETAPEFTAVGYFFGRSLHLARGTPIGLIHSSWGGSPAEAWTSEKSLETIPEFSDLPSRLDRVRRDPVGARAEFARRLDHWFEVNDPGSAVQAPWSAVSHDTQSWPTMRLPTFWEKAGLPDFDGVVWFVRDVEVPDSWAGRDVELHLGAIDDMDSTWVNGQFVGSGAEWLKPRVYSLHGGLLKPGRNVIAVRVLDTGGNGGLWGGGDTMRLKCAGSGQAEIPLHGDWRYKASVRAQHAPPLPSDPSVSSGTPSVLYNGMIAPLQPYAIRGVIWYQAEANSGQPQLYRKLFPKLVADWRSAWGQGDFPFLYVQVAPFNETPPEIREAQRLSLASITNSAMVVTIDVGDATDIHPTEKKTVGERLALAARALAYGEKLEYSGPQFETLRVDGSRTQLRFSHVGGGLIAPGGELKGFSIAGADGRFRVAKARILQDTVEVWAEEVPHPVAVRYGWAQVPEGNLFNRAGLPASPFASDSK